MKKIPVDCFMFGQMIDELVLSGGRFARLGWNGKGQFITIQRPTKTSKMTLPYIYMVTVAGHLVPWLASQTDMLSDDWYVVS